MTSTSPSAPPAAERPPGSGGGGQPVEGPGPVEIDLEALAREVYALLREELRLERERLGPAGYGS